MSYYEHAHSTRPAEFSFTFRLSRRVLYSSSGTGMNRQITAMVLPSTAIHTTETADGTRDEVLWKVERREQETKGARLHRRFDRHRSARRLAVLERAHDPVTAETADEMEQKGGSLKRETSADDALGAVGDGAADEDDGGRDADDGRDGFDAPAEFRRELVERETEDDGNEHDLDGGNRHAHGVDVDDGAERQLANQRRHEDASHRGGGRHEHGQRDITLGDVRAQVARLSTVDGTDENQPREERPLNPNAFPMMKANAGMSA